MKKNVLALLLLLFASTSFAGESWDIEITVQVKNARTRLVIGQNTDATDAIDNRYDIPARLTGDIQASIDLSGAPYWQDIRGSCISSCKKSWTISVSVDASLEGEEVALDWDFPPYDMIIKITDQETGETVSLNQMKQYRYINTGTRTFVLEAKGL